MTQPALDNVVVLVPGVPKELHFTDHRLGPVVMADPIIGLVRPVETLAFVVDLEDGLRVNKVYYVTARRHMADLSPYLEGQRYRDYDFTITARGEGLARTYTTVKIPHPQTA